ncbi:MAG: glycosyltransferase, partial [Prevotella sp.]|nr:glycosyltransferase [Prevotella sp.]
LIIDGASTDGSTDVIKKYADKIAYWTSEPDTGVYSAMNKGIRQAKGDYLLFINSGDYLTEDADLTAVTKHIQGEDLVYFNLRLLFSTGVIKTKKFPAHPDFKYFTVETLPHPATFIKKELFLKFGLYDEKMKICSDWAFFVRAVCLEHCSYKYVDDSFSLFCLDGMSYDKSNQQLVFDEKLAYMQQHFGLYVGLFQDWYSRGLELKKIKRNFFVRVLKRLKLIQLEE